MNYKLTIWIIIPSIVIIGCNQPNKIVTHLNDDEYAVMNALIESYYLFTNVRPEYDTLKTVRLYYTTIAGQIIKGNSTRFITKTDAKKWKSDSIFTIKSFYNSNDWESIDSSFKFVCFDTIKLDSNKFQLSREILLVGNNKVIESRNIPYSTPVIYLSRVGFNKTKTFALMYFYSTANGSSGTNALFKKENNRWQIVNDVHYWDGGIY